MMTLVIVRIMPSERSMPLPKMMTAMPQATIANGKVWAITMAMDEIDNRGVLSIHPTATIARITNAAIAEGSRRAKRFSEFMRTPPGCSPRRPGRQHP